MRVDCKRERQRDGSKNNMERKDRQGRRDGDEGVSMDLKS